MKKIKPLIISIAIALAVGALAGFLVKDSGEVYKSFNQPPLSPPGIVFPIVWTVLYILMGVSACLIYTSKSRDKGALLSIYALQLFFNFIWPIMFFGMQWLCVSFAWLVILWVLIIIMILGFYKAEPLAAYLQIPYLVWVTFAGYLNLGICLLN